MDDQEAFAALSGDRNPIHMDPVAARRTQAGAAAVHGIHALLWCLETLARSGVPIARTRRLSVKFAKFVHLGRQVVLRTGQSDAAGLRASVSTADNVVLLTVTMKFGDPESLVAGVPPPIMEIPAVPVVQKASDMMQMAATLSAPAPASAFEAAFPHLTEALGARRVAGLSLSSTVVGMICPGLRSIYSGLEATIVRDDGRDFWFRTCSVDDRFNMVVMEAGGAGISCQISAFERSPPVETDGMAALAALVAPREFAGMTAAILGGSRGLGAATAKLITAGGGRVTITYAQGRDDAERLRDEIRAVRGAGVCDIAPFDFHQPIAPQIAALPEGLTHLYYFSTPLIGRQKSPAYSRLLFDEFVHAYVDAFAEACTALRSRSTAGLRVFYPSSVYVADRPSNMTEYAMAKAAGEVLCEELARTDARLRILVARLPRVVTDQTASVIPTDAESAAVTMLPHIRALN